MRINAYYLCPSRTIGTSPKRSRESQTQTERVHVVTVTVVKLPTASDIRCFESSCDLMHVVRSRMVSRSVLA